MTSQPQFPVRPGIGALWLLAGIILCAINLRGPIVAPAPVLGLIQASLGMSAAASGLLTTLPVLCFGLLAPVASLIIGKSGANQAVVLSMGGVLLGTLLRSAGSTELALIGTVVIGASITVGNVVVPVIIHRDVPARRLSGATAAYTAALNVGSMATSILMAPLAGIWGWQLALLSWGAVSLAAAGLWIKVVGPRAALLPAPDRAVAAAPGSGGSTRVWTSPVAWALLLAFGGQAFAYYGVTAWLPTMLQDLLGQEAATAGAGSSLFQVAGVAGALGVPLLAGRIPLRYVVATTCVLWTVFPVGMIFAPEYWWLWSALAGAAQGAGVTVVFILVVRLARGSAHARGLSTMVQGGGYAISAVGPVVLGGLHESSGGWTVPLLAGLGAILVLLVLGWITAAHVDRLKDRPESRAAGA